MNRGRTLAFARALFALRPTAACADHVVLRNGDSLTGRVTSVSRSSMDLDTELAGHVVVKWPAIASLTGAAKVRATPAGGGDVVEGTIAVADGRIAIQRQGGATVLVDVDRLSTFDLVTGRPAPPRGRGR